jgi:hypothetical protein
VVLAGWGLFGLAQLLRSESGLMATVIAGLVLGASVPEHRLLRRFKGQLTILCVSVLFILLAADLSIASLFALGWGSLFTVLVLMFVVRPISIGLCTWNSSLNWRQKLFYAGSHREELFPPLLLLYFHFANAAGINGVIRSRRSYFDDYPDGGVAGLTAGLVANWLQITSKETTGAVIVGCNPLVFNCPSVSRTGRPCSHD